MPTVAERVVIDASAVLMLLLDAGARGDRVAHLLREAHVVAPELLPFEVWNVLRRRRARGQLAPAEADERRLAFADLPIDLWPTEAFAEGTWSHTGNLTAYDAAYVALAELLDATLITADQRLARAPGLSCRVELVA